MLKALSGRSLGRRSCGHPFWKKSCRSVRSCELRRIPGIVFLGENLQKTILRNYLKNISLAFLSYLVKQCPWFSCLCSFSLGGGKEVNYADGGPNISSRRSLECSPCPRAQRLPKTQRNPQESYSQLKKEAVEHGT